MHKQTLKSGEGRLWGVSNPTSQPNKMLMMYDGATTVLCILPLDEAFPERPTGGPGIVLEVIFTTELRVVTDGEGLKFYWQ